MSKITNDDLTRSGTGCFAEHQSAQISKITNDDLTRSGTGCFVAVPIWQQWTGRQRVDSDTV